MLSPVTPIHANEVDRSVCAEVHELSQHSGKERLELLLRHFTGRHEELAVLYASKP
jgi:hypothetical protein